MVRHSLSVVTRAGGAWLPGLAVLALTMPGVASAQGIGVFEAHGDIGSPKLAGRASYDPAQQKYTLSAGGVNMWGNRDEFHFVWKKLRGDFILQARLAFVGKGTDPHRKAGLMIRTSLEPDSAYADAAVHGDGLTSLQFRRTAGAITEQSESPARGADTVQLERKGNRIVMSAARFGDLYQETEIADPSLGDEVYVGLFVCSHNADVVETATFSNVRVVIPAPDSLRPYRDYLGSRLEILDVTTGDREQIFASQDPFEAPNWTTDGKALIYNTSGASPAHRGRLVRFDLASRTGTIIDTGFAIRNNNDHVLSFDGTMLAISDQSQGNGQSTIYTVPVTGGTPKQITKLTPSYLHGWSPDAKSLVYTGGRNGEFDVFRIASDGSGEETNLTKHPGLDDGPEYSPDGQWIYFNSVRSGTMQIWRMKPDGSSPEQVTNDDLNNWFPHVSPDGKWLAFITFPKDVPPAEHPYYKRVYLRLMPIAGGAPKVIAYVYGGQGTINVPSWAPDSRRLAFVSNSDRP